jgi:hypothetical protein
MERDETSKREVCWWCAALGALGVIGFLTLRVMTGFGLNPRYGLAFDDGGPLFYFCALFIVPTTGIGAGLGWYFRERPAMFGNLAVLGFFLVYGALGGPWGP